MKLRFIIPILILLLLCGCSYTEPEAVFTVTAIGCERVKNNAKLYLQITENTQEKDEVVLVVGEGENFEEALSDIRRGLSKKPSFSHCRFIAVSKDVTEKQLSEVMNLCLKNGFPLHSTVACTKNLTKLLDKTKQQTGEEIASLIKENASYFGFGGHSALFEIKTALIVSADKFALPLLTVESDSIRVNGLHYFSNGIDQATLKTEEAAL